MFGFPKIINYINSMKKLILIVHIFIITSCYGQTGVNYAEVFKMDTIGHFNEELLISKIQERYSFLEFRLMAVKLEDEKKPWYITQICFEFGKTKPVVLDIYDSTWGCYFTNELEYLYQN